MPQKPQVWLHNSLAITILLLCSVSTTLSSPPSRTNLTLTEFKQPQDTARFPPAHDLLIKARMPPMWAYNGIYDPSVGLIIPILVASVAGMVGSFTILLRLMSRIIDNCLSLWALQPPRNQVVIEAGNMRFEFGCTMMEPVPWDFIAEFAKSKEDALKRGFAPAFAREWWFDNHVEGRRCYVGIRLVPEGKEAVPPR